MGTSSSLETIVSARVEELQQLATADSLVIGYIYPHIPIELFLAHQIIPSLLWADPTVTGTYEASLQTFCCAYSRNLFSQRNTNVLPPIKGIVFPGGTCDSLLNLGDIWQARFPDDIVLRLNYPVATQLEAVTQYFTEELRNLSHKVAAAFNTTFSPEAFHEAVTLTAQFRAAAQYIATARIVQPAILPYLQYTTLIRNFLTHPSPQTLGSIEQAMSKVREVLRETSHAPMVDALRYALLQRQLTNISLSPDPSTLRIAVTGGMIDPQGLALLLESASEVLEETDAHIVIDLLTFGFRTIFTSSPHLEGDFFQEMAKATLSAPTEPYQEGLPNRLRFLNETLKHLHIDGLIICEQSFCDPDEFETPAIINTATKAKVPSVRLFLDPEFSDHPRLEGKLQSFLETLTSH